MVFDHIDGHPKAKLDNCQCQSKSLLITGKIRPGDSQRFRELKVSTSKIVLPVLVFFSFVLLPLRFGKISMSFKGKSRPTADNILNVVRG